MYNHLWWKPGWNCVWWKPGWNCAPRNGWKSRLSTSPNGEHDGEDDAIHEGDYAQIETDGSVFCWRRWRWRRLRKEATAFKLAGTHHVRTHPFFRSPTCERVFNVLSRGFKWLHIYSGGWFTRVLGHSACYVVRLLVLKERLGLYLHELREEMSSISHVFGGTI